jgi:cell division protein FtsL
MTQENSNDELEKIAQTYYRKAQRWLKGSLATAVAGVGIVILTAVTDSYNIPQSVRDYNSNIHTIKTLESELNHISYLNPADISKDKHRISALEKSIADYKESLTKVIDEAKETAVYIKENPEYKQYRSRAEKKFMFSFQAFIASVVGSIYGLFKFEEHKTQALIAERKKIILKQGKNTN